MLAFAIVNQAQFFRVALGILVLTALAKLASLGFANSQLLSYYDPLWEVQTRYVLGMVAAFELGVGGILMLSKNRILKCLVCSAAGAEFILYRIFNYLSDSPRPCPCLGALYDWIHINPRIFDGLLSGAAAFLFIGGMLYLFMESIGRLIQPRPRWKKLERHNR